MTYTISEHDAIQVVEVRNLLSELDNKAILKDIQNRMESGHSKYVVDLAKLKFMNSTGLNFLIMLMTKSKDSGSKLAIANASDQVINLLELTKLKSQFDLQASLDAAIRELEA